MDASASRSRSRSARSRSTSWPPATHFLTLVRIDVSAVSLSPLAVLCSWAWRAVSCCVVTVVTALKCFCR